MTSALLQEEIPAQYPIEPNPEEWAVRDDLLIHSKKPQCKGHCRLRLVRISNPESGQISLEIFLMQGMQQKPETLQIQDVLNGYGCCLRAESNPQTCMEKETQSRVGIETRTMRSKPKTCRPRTLLLEHLCLPWTQYRRVFLLDPLPWFCCLQVQKMAWKRTALEKIKGP